MSAHAEDFLAPFVRQMRAEMAANTAKGARWVDGDPEDLEYEILYHAVKLIWARRRGDQLGVCEYAADVANHAGMLAARAGGLPGPIAEGNASSYLADSDAARELATKLHDQILAPPV